MNASYEPHDANIYRRADGQFEVICQTPKCRFRLSPITDYAGQPADYTLAQREADQHSKWRFR